MPDAYAREALSVGTVATGPTPGTLGQSVQAVYGTVEGADVRLSYDGVDPTGTVGHFMPAGSSFQLEGASNARSLRLIRDSRVVVDATVTLTYER